MKTPADKSPEPQRQATTHEAPQQQDRFDAKLQFIDNREESASLRQLQEMADNSPRRQGQAQLRAMMDNGPHSAAMKNSQAMIHNSPRQVAQRQLHSRIQGASMGLQAGSDDVSVQRVEDEEVLQGKIDAESSAQLAQPSDAKPNNTGLPDNLKAGVESLSGLSLDNVKVHYNSSEPAQLNAHAYAQGTDIHVGPGQEQHLPHEAWHVVQQAQGRVKPTMQMKDGVEVNDDQGLEQEADLMGGRAEQMVQKKRNTATSPSMSKKTIKNGEAEGKSTISTPLVQRRAYVGNNFSPPKGPIKSPVLELYNDNNVRRFKDETELKNYADNNKLEGIGALGNKNWVRLPTKMLVLGEDHGKPMAPDIIKATNIKKFRYEGFTHYDLQRLEKNEGLKELVEESNKQGLERKGLEQSEDEPSHEAEDAFPKYARVLPDIIAMVKEQASKGKIGGKSVVAGADLGDDYSLAKALLSGLTLALVYCKSYGDKSWGNELKSFYNTNKQAVDDSIGKLEKYKKNNVVPDFNEIKIMPLLNNLAVFYEKMARKKVNQNTRKKRKDFIATLNTKDEPKVAMSDKAKEMDYLRDASMLMTIKKAKSSGDRLFVIGDAHRHKLAPLIAAEGLDVKKDVEFIQEQQELDIDAIKTDDKPKGEFPETLINEIAKKILSGLKVTPPTPSESSRREKGVERRITPSLTLDDNATLIKKFGFILDISVEGGELSGDVTSGKEMPKIINTDKRTHVTIKLLRNNLEIHKKNISS